MKKCFTSTPILAHFHNECSKMLKTDASDLAKGAVLSQLEPDKKWHPLAFYSKKFTLTKEYYNIYD